MAKKALRKLRINKQDGMAYLLLAMSAITAGVVLTTGILTDSDFARVFGGSLLATGAILMGISISCNLKTIKTQKK